MTEYLPILRSRAAELRGLRELGKQELGKLVPIIELTRSRRSSKNPNGDISKSVESVCEILGGQEFVADLTSLSSLQNPEIVKLLDDADGFANWTAFANAVLPENCIPTVHLLDPFEIESFKTQAGKLRSRFRKVAIRVPTSYTTFRDLIDASVGTFNKLSDVILTLDAGYVTKGAKTGAIARLVEMLTDVSGKDFGVVSVAASSFPSSVVAAGGGDDEGQFPLSEVILWDDLKGRFKEIDYSDYAAIHPMDFTGTVTNWVPRIDVMLDKSFYYRRYRRSDGGYVRAAKEAYQDSRYVPLDCWAQQNIREAAAGSPNGRSPSFWIANRVNFHLTRQVLRMIR